MYIIVFDGRMQKTMKGIHWSSWKYPCLPKLEGGLGLCNLNMFNIALLVHLDQARLSVSKGFKVPLLPTHKFS